MHLQRINEFRLPDRILNAGVLGKGDEGEKTTGKYLDSVGGGLLFMRFN